CRAFGIPFPSIRERLDLLEETAGVLRRLFDGERVTFDGRQLHLTDALCDPRPLQPRLRLWIGGQGERRLLRIVARHADGWNAPFLAPEPSGSSSRSARRSTGKGSTSSSARSSPPSTPERAP